MRLQKFFALNALAAADYAVQGDGGYRPEAVLKRRTMSDGSRLIAVLRETAAGTAAIDLLLSIARTQRSTPMWGLRPVEVANAGPCTLPTLDKNILLATYSAPVEVAASNKPILTHLYGSKVGY